MKEIALVIHEDATLSTITGAMDMLIHTNRLFQHSGKPQPFKITLAHEKNDHHLQIPASLADVARLDEISNPDLIIVPAFYGDRDEMLKKHSSIISWINTRY